MNREFYADIEYSPTNREYLFTSVGKKGRIRKIALFQKLDGEDNYNFFFSDYTEGKIADDRTATDNGDLVTVFATLAVIAFHFFEGHPKAKVVISGSEPVRKRLYARIIYTNYEELKKEFSINCTDGARQGYKPYLPIDRYYVPYAFLISREMF